MNEVRAELLILIAKDGASDEEAWQTLYLARCLLLGRMEASQGFSAAAGARVRQRAAEILKDEKEKA
jgi:hypothetical protein